MEALTANEAKTQFGDLLLKAQQAPIQINKNGKPVAVVISISEYEHMEALKMEMLRSRAEAAKGHIASRDTVDGESFFDELQSARHDPSD
jgi:prevent-host-death family protein